MATTQTQPNTGAGLQVYYKPLAGQQGYTASNPQAVYDSQGNLVSLDQYKTATGQTGVPDNKIDWSAVQNGAPVGGFQASAATQTFNPSDYPGLAGIWGQLTPAQQAFTQSAYGILKGQYEYGGPVQSGPDLWNQALQFASQDPTIKSQYGDVATQGLQQLQSSIATLTGNYDATAAKQEADRQQAQGALNTQIEQAGQAYSGFRNKAQNQLNAQQNQIIQSTKSQLQQNLQQLGSNYEAKFGSTAAGAQPISVANSGVPNYGAVGYTPVGGIIGSNPQNQLNAEAQFAVETSGLPSVDRSTGVASTTGTASSPGAT